MLTLFCTSMFVVCVVSSLPPDDLSTSVAMTTEPFNSGFSKIFRISPVLATALSVPATYATAYGFIFGASRIMIAMAKSGLYPPIMKQTYGKFSTPYVAILIGSLIGYIVCMIIYFYPVVQRYIFNICILSALTGYISQLIGYIIFTVKYGNREREFRSPFGIPGAVYALIIFTLAFIGIVGFQDDNSVSFIIYLILLTMYSIYYLLYAKKRQDFSPDERFIYLINIVKCKYVGDVRYNYTHDYLLNGC